MKRIKPYVRLSEDSFYGSNFNVELRTPSDRLFLEIGSKSVIDGCFIFENNSGNISVGSNVEIAGGSTLISINKIDIEDDVIIGWGCVLYDHNSHSTEYKKRKNDVPIELINHKESRPALDKKDWSSVKSAPICIKRGAWIGFGSTILKGVTVGEGAIVAAKSVVVKDIPPYTIWGGNPACYIKDVD